MVKHFQISFLLVTLFISACTHTTPDGETVSSINKKDVGSIAGAIGGAFVGQNVGGGNGAVLASTAGTLLGSFIGGQIGQSLDRADTIYMRQTNQNALETTRNGTVSTWNNPDSGKKGTITPTKTYQNSGGNYCREFTQTIRIGGENQEAFGKACRQADGSWKLQG